MGFVNFWVIGFGFLANQSTVGELEGEGSVAVAVGIVDR